MTMRVLLLAAVTLISASGLCAAQAIHWTQADDMVPQGAYIGASAGDLDGDSDFDLTVTGRCQYWNVGEPQEPVWVQDVNQFPGIPFCLNWMGALGDVDDDGDLDLLVGCFYSPGLRLYRNTGNPPDDPSWEYDPILEWFPWTGPRDPCLADIDGDGDLDIFMGCSGIARLMPNEGTPSAPDWSLGFAIEGVVTYTGAGLGDIDGDGDLDLVGIAYDGLLSCWENIGTPQSYQFVENPDLVPVSALGQDMDVWDIEIFDLDDDGDQDLLITTSENHYFFLNDGPVTPVEQSSWGTIKALYR
jgi:hypothetical protein